MAHCSPLLHCWMGLRALGKRYNLTYWWVSKLVHEWIERAIALGYVQVVPPAEPFQANGDPEATIRA